MGEQQHAVPVREACVGCPLHRKRYNHFQTVEEHAESDPDEYECLMALKDARWEEGLTLLSTLDELVTPE